MLNKLISLYVTGQPDEVKSTSGRIVNLTLCLTSLVLLAAYSAFLISSLAVQHRDLPFRDLQGLLHEGSYRLGIEKDNYLHNMFEVWWIDYLWTDYLLGICLVEGAEWWGKSMSFQTSSFGNYVRANHRFEFIIIIWKVFEIRNPIHVYLQRIHHTNCRHVQWY